MSRPVVAAALPATEPITIPITPITEAERSEILTLIARRETIAANEKITALMQRDPRTAWPHVALAELHMRNLWRRDVVRQWLTALRLDPTLKDDHRLATHLCLARGAKWDNAGVAELWAALGEHAAALRGACSSAAESAIAAAHPDGSAADGLKAEVVKSDESPSGPATADANPGNVPDAGTVGAER